MKSSLIPLIYGLLNLAIPVSCKHKKATINEFQKSALINEQIQTSFKNTFPKKLLTFEEPPSIDTVGELITTSPKFMLNNFPQSNMEQLKFWAQPLTKSLNLDSISFSYFEHHPDYERNLITGMGIITFNQDGTSIQQQGLSIKEGLPKVSLKGQHIPTSKANKAQ